MKRNITYSIVKRTFDIAASAALVVVTIPLCAGISVVVRAESEGPVIFLHDRMGRYGRHFRMLKFRSMKAGSDDIEASLSDEEIEEYFREYKLPIDPRVTKIGRWLRSTSLDELPQLFNVLQGNMSLVGPRPITEAELDNYTPDERRKLLSVRPGLTGYWQVNGRNEVTYQTGERQTMELWYIDNASVKLDLEILMKTPRAVISRKGAH